MQCRLNPEFMSLCLCRSGDFTLWISLCWCNSVEVSLFMLLSWCNSIGGTLLRLLFWCHSVDIDMFDMFDGTLLMSLCWWYSVDVNLLMSLFSYYYFKVTPLVEIYFTSWLTVPQFLNQNPLLIECTPKLYNKKLQKTIFSPNYPILKVCPAHWMQS